MARIIKLFVGLIAVLIAGIIGITALSGAEDVLSDAASSAKNTAMNAALDASGVKDRVQSALESHVDDIAAATGLSTAAVERGISDLAVQDWQVTDLPDDSQKTGSYSGSAAGIDGTLTTYADPSYVTVDAYGQNLTLSVPASAQPYLEYLSYLDHL